MATSTSSTIDLPESMPHGKDVAIRREDRIAARESLKVLGARCGADESSASRLVEVEDDAAVVIERLLAKFEQALECVDANGALLHAGLGVACEGGLHGRLTP